MIQIKKDKWNIFRNVYKSYGFEYIPPIPKLRKEAFLNKKYNIIVDIETRIVTSFQNVDNNYHNEFDLILLLYKDGYLNCTKWRGYVYEEI